MSAATDRSIKTILNELEFLNEEGIVNRDEFETMVEVLSTKTREAKRKQSEVSLQAPSLTESRPSISEPATRILEAKYEFNGTESSDLSLKPGMRIELYEELNNDWWRGRSVDTGREGIFPSNYVVEVANPDEKKKQTYENSNASTASSYYKQAPPNYYGQQLQQTPSNNYPQPYDPNSVYQPNGSNPAVYQQEAQMVVVQQQEHHHDGRVANGAKRFGKRFGDAAIFGAGATVGSNIINGIF